MDVICGKLYRNQPKNLNHVHKEIKDLVSVIITMGKDISGGDTVFYDGMKSSEFGSRDHILKHLHGRMVFGQFEKVFYEGTLWSKYRDLISFILKKQIFLHIFRHGNQFYDLYLNSVDKKIYIDDDGSSEKPKLEFQRRLLKFSCWYQIQKIFYRYRKEARQNFGKRKNNWVHFFFLGQDSVKLKVT